MKLGLKHRATALLMGVLATAAGAADDTHAERAVLDSGRASAHASGSAAHGIAASGQATSAIMAVPLSVGGAVLGTLGDASTGAAQASMNAAKRPVGAPLELTEEVITIMPPNQALQTPTPTPTAPR